MNCHSCGREVKPTMHKREGAPLYRVDYYTLVTGTLSHTSIQNPNAESEFIEYYKLSDPRTIVTCAECMNDGKVAANLDELFRELPEERDGRESGE